MSELVVVEFTKAHGRRFKGDRVKVDPVSADRLVEAKVAKVIDADPPAPETVAPVTAETLTATEG